MGLLPTTLLRVADQLERSQTELNRLDGVAGDGDLGVTASLIAQAIRDVVAGETAAGDQLLRSCAIEIARKAPSSCGTLIATALLRASPAAASTAPAVARLADGLAAAVSAVGERGGVSVGDRTMLDALAPASEAARRAASSQATIDEALVQVASAAESGATATRDMKATVGRAGWLSDRAAGHVDAGAELVALVFRACAGPS